MTEPSSTPPHEDETLIQSLTERAKDAFWQVIVQQFPEAKTGDLSPLTSVRLTVAAQDAIREWIWANVPSTNAQE